MTGNRVGISGNALKIIAVVTMLIDHVGAAVIARMISAGGLLGMGIGTVAASSSPFFAWLCDVGTLRGIYTVFRTIGRIAFPIYCFLLVEGFVHTHSRWRYALRLFMFALISEVPFDLAFRGRIVATGYQNVYYTLLIGLLVMMGVDSLNKKNTARDTMQQADDPICQTNREAAINNSWTGNMVVIRLLQLAVILAGFAAAHFFHTDYALRGVLVIVALFLFRKDRMWQIVAGCVAFVWWEPFALLAFIPIAFYNGERGRRGGKWFFYIFYPAHLLILYILCACMKIA